MSGGADDINFIKDNSVGEGPKSVSLEGTDSDHLAVATQALGRNEVGAENTFKRTGDVDRGQERF